MRKFYMLFLLVSCVPLLTGITAMAASNSAIEKPGDHFVMYPMDFESALVLQDDTVAPQVVNVTPTFDVDEEAGTATAVFVVTYTEDISLGDSYKFTLHRNPGPDHEEIEEIEESRIEVDGNTVTISPASVLTLTERYELVGTYGSVVDAAGNVASSLTHVFIYDQTPPQFVSVSPNLNQLQDLEVAFTLTYNENVQLAPNYQILIYHFPPGQEKVEFERFDENSITVEENTITLTPTQQFEAMSTYEIVITAGSVMDMAGNLAGSLTRTFSTIDTTLPTVVQRSSDFSPNGRLVLVFSKPVNINDAQATIRRQADNEVVATVPLEQEGARQYVIRYDISGLEDDNEKFVIEIDEDLIADEAGNLWTGFGDDTWIVGLPDRTAPELLTVEPNLDEPVARNAIFTLTFSEDVKLAPTYVLEFKFYEDDGGPYNPANWVIYERLEPSSITVMGNKIVLDPVKLFDVTDDSFRAQYELVISSGSVTDLAGNPFYWGERTSYSKTFDVTDDFVTFVMFNPAEGDTLNHMPEVLTVTFSQDILLADAVEVDEETLQTMVYLNRGGEEVPFTATLDNSRMIRITPDASVVPEYGAQYTYGFTEGFFDASGVEYDAQEVTFVLRDISVTIAEVRGDNEVSPLQGETVRITGTVTAIFPGEGFFMQDENAARSGIWVAYANTDTLETGGGVVVIGEVAELNQVTSVEADRIYLTEAPLTVEPIVIDWTTDSIEMYESILVQVTQGRASAAGEQGAWRVYFDETTDSVHVGNRLLVYAPVENNLYNVTGIVSNRGGVYRLQPRTEADVVDVTDPVSAHIPSGIEFNVYPNPFEGHIRITNHDKLTRVVVSNITGQLVIDQRNPGAQINTSRLISGVYIISLFDENGLAKTSRIIKR